MGTGDWNDGMSLVGAGGKGESVWLGWFLVSILRPFADLAESRGDAARADALSRQRATTLATALEEAWDGDWYRRAYFDDGTPLGSKENTECQIDAIAQSWAVISGAGDPERARQAMAVGRRATRPSRRRHRAAADAAVRPRWSRAPATSGATCPASARTAASTRTRRSGTCWRSPSWATAIAPAELFSLLNPVNHGRTAEDVAPLPRRTVCRRGRRLLGAAAHRARRLDLVHRVRRLDVPGRHRSHPRHHAAAAARCTSIRASRRAGPASRSSIPPAARAIGSSSRTRTASAAAWSASKWTARRSPDPTCLS